GVRGSGFGLVRGRRRGLRDVEMRMPWCAPPLFSPPWPDLVVGTAGGPATAAVLLLRRAPGALVPRASSATGNGRPVAVDLAGLLPSPWLDGRGEVALELVRALCATDGLRIHALGQPNPHPALWPLLAARRLSLLPRRPQAERLQLLPRPGDDGRLAALALAWTAADARGSRQRVCLCAAACRSAGDLLAAVDPPALPPWSLPALLQ